MFFRAALSCLGTFLFHCVATELFIGSVTYFPPPPPPLSYLVFLCGKSTGWVPSVVPNVQIHTDFKYKILSTLEPPWEALMPEEFLILLNVVCSLLEACSGPSLEHKIS